MSIGQNLLLIENQIRFHGLCKPITMESQSLLSTAPGAYCCGCGTAVKLPYVREQAKKQVR